jgi:hypothetical protein
VRFPRSISFRRFVVPTALALVAIGLFSVGAAAASPTATATITSSAAAGSKQTLTLTVTPASGTVFTVAVTTPSAGWTLSNPSSGTLKSNDDGTTTLTDTRLKIGPMTTYTLTVDARVPCSFATNTWTLLVTQKNGTAYEVNQPTTDVKAPSECTAAFSHQPANTGLAPDVIYATPYWDTVKVPAMPTPMAVTIRRGDGSTDLSYAQTVTLSLANNPAAATLGGVVSVNAVKGVADTFRATIDKASSGYRLSAAARDVAPVESNDFAIVKPDAFHVCNATSNEACAIHLSNPGVETDVSTTNPKTGQTAIIGGATTANFACPGQLVLTSTAIAIDSTGDGNIVVSEVISKDVMNQIPQNGIALVGVCVASLVSFIQDGGTPAVFDPTINLYVGLLPKCSSKIKVKCVSQFRKDMAGAGHITYILDPNDPPRRL